ncbi:bacterial Ig-like domain-containing protein [Companilactobacillus keshanensis]|uniref:Bacterial Ig-like domain-containing protein n=1 Tax=Companilactobacillus keshanensis TaxID=2486003 RepID=A0ABW4BT68_9LACO|nr:bacterial Ig-like domain-containing protein [Companilactobacillus keshanensis]
MANIKLSKSQKVTIAGVTLFSALILGGLSTTNVSAATEQPATDQVVGQNNDQINNGTTSSGTKEEESAPDTGSGTGSNTGQNDQNAGTGNAASGSNSSTGVTGSDDTGSKTTGSGITSGNSLSSNINAYIATPVATATAQVPVANSQKGTIDWNNTSNYDPSANSGIIINYKVETPDSSEVGDFQDQKGQAFIVGNTDDTVDLTSSLPQGYTFVNASDKDQVIGAGYDGTDAKTYINSITKTINIVRAEGSTDDILPAVYSFVYGNTSFPALYLEYIEQNLTSTSAIAFTPIGFLTKNPTILTNSFHYSGMHSNTTSIEVFKDNKTLMTNTVNFKLGNDTLSTYKTDSTKLGDTAEVTAPTGYTFSDGTTTKNITIGAASPMYLAYYSTLGITDIDPSIHDLEVVKAPVVISDKTVNLSVADGTVWDPESAYDATNSTDENNAPIPYANLTVTIQKVDSAIPETGTTIDQSKPGQYTITYAYGEYSSTTAVNVRQTPTLTVTKDTDDVTVNDQAAVSKWLGTSTDEYGNILNYDNVNLTVSVDGKDIAKDSELDTTTAGTHDVTYKYSYMSGYEADGVTPVTTDVTKTVIVNVNRAIVEPVINVKDSTLVLGNDWKTDDNFISATDEYGDNLYLSKITVDSSNIQADKAGVYNVIFKYKDTVETAKVTVTQTPTINSVPSYDVMNSTSTKPWDASEAFNGGTDENGNPLTFNKVTVSVDGVITNDFKPSVVGIHPVVYSYAYGDNQTVDSSTILHVKQAPTLAVSGNLFKLGSKVNLFSFINNNVALDENNVPFSASNTNLTYIVDGIDYQYDGIYTVLKLGNNNASVKYTYYINGSPMETSSEISIIGYQDPVINSQGNTEYTVGDAVNISDLYGSTSTDEYGNILNYDNVDLTVSVDGTVVDKDSVLDTATAGTHDITYKYSYLSGYEADGVTTRTTDVTKTVTVNVNRAIVAPVINVKDSTLSPGNDWKADDNFVSATDEYGDNLDLSKITVDSSNIQADKAGVYNVIFKYKDTVEAAKVTVTQAPTLVVQPSSVHVGLTWDPADSFVSATDENGKDVALPDITVNSSALKLDTPGTYDVTFTYGDITRTTQVTVTASTVLNVHDSTIHVGDKWSPADNFDNATDSDGNSVGLDKVTETDNVDTTKAGIYKATYTVNDLSKDATIVVLANSTTDPGTPSTDKEWLINAPYLVKADNYTQIYSSPSTSDPVANRQLVHDSDWMVGLAVQNSEGTFYQVSTSEWVKAEDMWAFKPIADEVYANDPNNTAVFSTVDENKNTDINISYQTAWLVDRVAVDNDGNTWYRVGTSNYVKSSDVTKIVPETSYKGNVQLTGMGNVTLYKLDYYGHIEKASRNAASGTNWISTNHRELKGITYHQISNSEWVSEIDSVFTKQD